MLFACICALMYGKKVFEAEYGLSDARLQTTVLSDTKNSVIDSLPDEYFSKDSISMRTPSKADKANIDNGIGAL